MKSRSAQLKVILLVIGLTLCSVKTWGSDWREFAQATTGVFFYDKESVNTTSEGFLRAWIHNTTKNESALIEIDCKEKNYRVLDFIENDASNQIKERHLYYDAPGWQNISQKTIPEPLHSILCP